MSSLLQVHQATNLRNASLLFFKRLSGFPNPRPRFQSNFRALSFRFDVFLPCCWRSWCFPLLKYLCWFIWYEFLNSLCTNGEDGSGIDEAFNANVVRRRRRGGDSAPTRRNRPNHTNPINTFITALRLGWHRVIYVRFDSKEWVRSGVDSLLLRAINKYNVCPLPYTNRPNIIPNTQRPPLQRILFSSIQSFFL